MLSLGKSIDIYKNEKGVSQKDIATATGLTPYTISRMKRGDADVMISSVDLIAAYFNVDTGVFITRGNKA